MRIENRGSFLFLEVAHQNLFELPMNALRFISFVSFFLFLGLTTEASLQIEVDYKGEYYQVIDAKRALPVIEVNGKKRSVTRSQIRVNQEGEPPVEDAYFMIRNRSTKTQDRTMQGGPRSRFFVFRAEIKSNMDLKNNFIAVAMKNEYGQSRLVLYELRDLKADKWTKVSFSVPTDNSQNKGGYQQFVFSNGTQVLDEKQYNQQQRRRKR